MARQVIWVAYHFTVMNTRLALALSVALVFTQLLACGGSHAAVDAGSAETQKQLAADDARGRATTRLAGMTDWSNAAFIAGICEESDLTTMTSDVKSRCAVAHLATARDFLTAGNLVGAHKALDLASHEGASADALASTVKLLQAAEEAQPRMARDAYAQALRQRYLDQNLDIEVKVSGKDNDRLTLKFVLFNAVWTNKVEKGSLLAEMRGLGFKRVDLTDGVDYHVFWDFEKQPRTVK
jgi:hypothetical protein